MSVGGLQCEHGSLARSCYTCELEGDRRGLQVALANVREEFASWRRTNGITLEQLTALRAENARLREALEQLTALRAENARLREALEEIRLGAEWTEGTADRVACSRCGLWQDRRENDKHHADCPTVIARRALEAVTPAIRGEASK